MSPDRRTSDRRSIGLKAVCLVCLVGLFLAAGAATPALAEQAWVDGLRITVRRGPGVDYRIRDFVPAGAKVEILGRKAGWSRVKIASGATGWVLSRFLTDQAPLATRLDLSQARHAELNRANRLLLVENEDLKRRIEEMELAAARIEERIVRQRNERLEEYHLALSTADRLIDSHRTAIEIGRREEMGGDDLQLWFAIGAGAAAMGLVLGELSSRLFGGRRKTRPSL